MRALFSGANVPQVYYSGSMYGVSETDIHLPGLLVNHIKGLGAVVLDEHVALYSKNKEEAFLALIDSLGFTMEEWLTMTEDEQYLAIYKYDIALVDKSTHLVVLGNGPSHGVGMEVQRALDKPYMNMPVTPVLVLVHLETTRVSVMIHGPRVQYDHMYVVRYSRIEDAYVAIEEFLT